MTLLEYQNIASQTCLGQCDNNKSLVYGLVSEVGEVTAILKRQIRDGVNLSDKDKLTAEIGDVLWYLSQIARVNNINLSQAAVENLEKLAKRHASGKITGSGNDR